MIKNGGTPLRRTIQDHIGYILTSTLKIQVEKDLKAVMTSNGNIQIKSAKKIEKTEELLLRIEE